MTQVLTSIFVWFPLGCIVGLLLVRPWNGPNFYEPVNKDDNDSA